MSRKAGIRQQIERAFILRCSEQCTIVARQETPDYEAGLQT
ncbi:MAG TPA: hypothetical protein VH183_09510 [Burkholderiaceae bacterium]|jgi:hypothetical protein|nr:hypothetical protein [Burkholderiaceae bacterium]